MAHDGEQVDDRPFEVSSSPQSAGQNSESEGTNVCRVAALSAMLGGRTDAIAGLGSELGNLGFSDGLRSGEVRWTDNDDPLDSFDGLGGDASDRGDRDPRVYAWQMVNEMRRPREAVTFLAAVLGSELERESAAAAAALWRQLGSVDLGRWSRRRPDWPFMWERLFDLPDLDWPGGPWGWPFPWQPSPLDGDPTEPGDELAWEPEQWQRLYSRVSSRFGDPYSNAALLSFLASWRLRRALRSPDPVTRSFALAAFQPDPEPDDDGEGLGPTAPSAAIPPGALVVSTMVHGTWGWKGDWWRPRGGFHEFILRTHRPNLYSRGAKFSWSGAYSDGQRAQAAIDFNDWAYDVAPNGLQTVFGHSYGGEVVCRAALSGSRIHELVLLSAPVSRHVQVAAAAGRRIVDVRLRFDPVLALARRRQRLNLASGVVEVLLDRWRLDHGATHREEVWRDEDVARRGGL